MTTVLAYAGVHGVVMAADTMTNVFDRRVPGAARKIMRLEHAGGSALLGLSGNAGMVGVIRAAWRDAGVCAPPAGEQQEWAEEVAALLTRAVLDADMKDPDGRMDGHFLLGVPGWLWSIYHYAAVPHREGFSGVGTGEAAAVAALDVLLVSGMEPVEAVRRAAEVAVRRDLWSGLPLQVEVLAPAAVAG